jgi:carnosine N-methyltransferase
VEVAAAGFEAQGNEFSYFMLIAAAFMLNATAVEQQWTVHPWVHLTCNNISDDDQLRPVCVPDVVPGDVVPPGLLSMCAGDFAVRRPAWSCLGGSAGCGGQHCSGAALECPLV